MDRCRYSAPAAAIARGDRRVARSAAAARTLARSDWRRGLDVALPPGLGVDDGEDPDRRELELARVGDVHGDDLVVQDEGAQRLRPVVVAEEVGDDDDLAAARLRHEQPAQRAGEVGAGAGRARLPRGVVDAASAAMSHAAPAPRRERAAAGRCRRRSTPSRLPPRTVSMPKAAAAPSTTSRFSAVGGAEVEAGRAVDHDPGLELAVGLGRAAPSVAATGP